MDVGSLILGRPWLYDKDVTIHGQSNICSFKHQGKRIKTHSSQVNLSNLRLEKHKMAS